jgi:hypothetical protein
MKKQSMLFDRLDFFAETTPQFNIEGKRKISSHLGCVFSLLMVLIMFCYSSTKILVLMTSGRVTISSTKMHSARGLNEKVDLRKHNFQIAFSVDRVLNGSEELTADDSEYVEWIAMMEEHLEHGHSIR